MKGARLRLHLLRHADAGDPAAWDGPDDARPLSDKGRHQAERLGRLLAAIDFTTAAIISSPLLRARQTAEIVGDALGMTVRIDDRLADRLSFSLVEEILADADAVRDAILVGHDPDFTTLLSSLIGANVPMRKGAFASLEIDGRIGTSGGVLRCLVPPGFIPG